jgi:hypothetical protein
MECAALPWARTALTVLKDKASGPQGVRIAAGLGEKTGFLRRTERHCVPDHEGDRLSRDLPRRLLPSAGLRW